MREAIERVIAELETECKRNHDIEKRSVDLETTSYRQGGQDGLAFTINKLKAVLADETCDTGNASDNERDS